MKTLGEVFCDPGLHPRLDGLWIVPRCFLCINFIEVKTQPTPIPLIEVGRDVWLGMLGPMDVVRREPWFEVSSDNTSTLHHLELGEGLVELFCGVDRP